MLSAIRDLLSVHNYAFAAFAVSLYSARVKTSCEC